MRNIFIVDDDFGIVNILKDIISNHFEDAEIGTAMSGKEAIEGILLDRPEVVLLDYLLPDCDGLHVIRQIQQVYQPSIIMISEVSDKEMISKAYRENIAFFITKPINVIEVISIINQVVEYQNIRKTLNQFEMAIQSINKKKVSVTDQHISYEHKLKRVYSKLGIVGVNGCDDLIKGVLWAKNQSSDYNLSDLYNAIIDSSDNAQQFYAVKKRISRVITKAFKVLAAMGIEDQFNPIFEDYSSQLFDYTELRIEMKALQGKSIRSGKINIKQFIESSIVMIDS